MKTHRKLVIAVAVVGAAFSLWVTFASGYQSVYQAMLLLLLGLAGGVQRLA